jgi:flagellar basal body rod protein FlgG
MLYGLYLSTAGMQAEDYRQSVFSNNLANTRTTGFKRDLATIMARQGAVDEDPAMAGYRVPVLSRQGGGVFAAPTRIDLSQGVLEPSSSKLDVALKGPGFFMVKGNDNQTMLTRDGRFLLNKDNQLSTQDGNQVLDDTGSPITLNPAANISISGDGQISQDGTKVAELGMRDVNNPLALQKVGGNLMGVRDGGTLEPVSTDTEVKQGFTEDSGVDPIVEMVNMMEGQRAFEANARMVTFQDLTLQQINAMGRLA